MGRRRRKTEADPVGDALAAGQAAAAFPSTSATAIPDIECLRPGSDSVQRGMLQPAPPLPIPAIQSVRVVHGPSRPVGPSVAVEAAEGRGVVGVSALHGPQPAAFTRSVHGPDRKAEPVEVTVPTLPDPSPHRHVMRVCW